MKYYAKASKVHAGSRLLADSGFECIEPDVELVVGEDEQGLFVPCNRGNHYLIKSGRSEAYVGFIES